MSFPIRETSLTVVVPPETIQSTRVVIRELISKVRIEETGKLRAENEELSDISGASIRASIRGNRDGLDVGRG